MNIEQLRKDMEAGTQGDWVVDGRGITSTSLHAMDCIIEHVYGSEPDARRIARVPQLERIALAAEGLADAVNITAKQELDPIVAWSGSPLTRALAAYRKATK